jgi:hypothetical protein
VGCVKALFAMLAIVLVVAFVVVRQPDDGEANGGHGTGSASGGSLGARCTVFADVPALNRAGWVAAVARYRCADVDGGVDTTVYLERRDAKGGWANVDRQPMAATGADATRRRPANERMVRVSAPCAPGSYRTFVGGTVSNGERGFYVQAASKPVTLACIGGPTPGQGSARSQPVQTGGPAAAGTGIGPWSTAV